MGRCLGPRRGLAFTNFDRPHLIINKAQNLIIQLFSKIKHTKQKSHIMA